MSPPVAKHIPRDVSVHGEERVDPYYWLRERDNPEVIAYLTAENDFTRRALAHTEPLQNELYQEMLGRIQETDSSVPVFIDGYYYYERTEAGKQYEIHCRKKRSLDAPEEILIDENVLAQGHPYFSIGAFRLSPDHNLLAYSLDTTGDETHTIFVKDLRTGVVLDPGIGNAYYGLEWANDNETLFYTTLDESKRADKLYRRRIGTDPNDDVLVYEEKDEAFFVGIGKTRSRRFITMSIGSNTTTEEHFLDADAPEDEFTVIHPRQHELEYYLAHHEDVFYILTNDNAKNFRLMKAPTADPSRDNWREVVAHRNDVKIDDIDVFRNHLVMYERHSGLKKINVMNLATEESHYVGLPESVYTFWPGSNPMFDTDTLRFNYTSMVEPRTVYDYDIPDQEMVELKKYEVLGGFDSEQYTTERIFASANDGTRVPISLVYRKGLRRDGQAPLFLYGYGAYGASIEPYFVANRLSLLDRGFVYAIAHVRGGGEMGRPWYEAGKLLNKRNTFTDFLACAEHLISKGYTSAGRIAGYGGSAGGLLMGAVLNMRPELWNCVVAHVPFVDVITTMLDESIPLTVIEYEEWGNPNDKKHYEYMRSYSPYDNLRAQDYPHLLVTAGLNDPRVQYWEPAKWAARLRTIKTDTNMLFLKTKMTEGHSGASGRYDYLRDIAFEYAFVLTCCEMVSER